MTEPQITHVIIHEVEERGRVAFERGENVTVVRTYHSGYSSEDAAIKNAELTARTSMGRLLVCEVVAVTECAPTTRRVGSGHPLGGDRCWGCSRTRAEHPNEVGCSEWHGKDDV